MSDEPSNRATKRTGSAGFAEPGPFLAERAWMRFGHVAQGVGWVAFAMALVHCGGGDNSGGPGDQDANGPVADAAENGNDGGETAVDGTAPDSTIARGPDAGDASQGVLDATADARPDATAGTDTGTGEMGSSDAGPDATGVTVGADTGTGDAGDGAPLGAGDVDATDAADAALPPLVCGSQTCAQTEFCGTFAGDAGVDGASDAGDQAPDGGTSDGGVVLACTPGVLGNICDNPTATLFFDAYEADNQAATTIGAALASACGMTVESPDAAPFNPTSGQPMTGIGNLCVIGGGSYGQPVTAYLDNHLLTDVVVGGGYDDANIFDINFTDRANPGGPVVLASAPYSATPTNTDYFLVELATDPASGSLCLDVLGLTAQGTTAGAYYVANHLLGNGAFQGSTNSWYVYYWASADDGGVPSDADTFTFVASGP
jgi:hypothetical protein